MRIPVSILPGTKTRAGHGAEVHLTLTPELGNELLPETFRDLVINDLVDQLSLPILKVAERTDLRPIAVTSVVEAEYATYEALVREINGALTIAQRNEEYPGTWPATLGKVRALFGGHIFGTGYILSPEPGVPAAAWRDIVAMRRLVRAELDKAFAKVGSLDYVVTELLKQAAQDSLTECSKVMSLEVLLAETDSDKLRKSLNNLELSQITGALRQVDVDRLRNAATSYREFYDRTIVEETNKLAGLNGSKRNSKLGEIQKLAAQREVAKKIEELPTPAKLVEILRAVQGQLKGKLDVTNVISAASPRARRARYAVAPSELVPVLGEDNILAIASTIRAFGDASDAKRLHLPDVQSLLREQLHAAYKFLALPNQGGLWQLCPSISLAVRQLDYGSENSIQLSRASFEEVATPYRAIGASSQGDSIRALAWAILVESALLNDRLLEDIQRIERDQACQIVSEHQPGFYGPNPPPEARRMFNEYVRKRWPIHIFAIDPESQDQNVADAFARRRESQLAASLAITRGEISADTFTRFARRLDFELETVALNRTVIGFSHGHNTFGWRMYPRVQAPPTEGNLKVAVRDLLIGGPSRERDLQFRQLEPGPRELLAVVMRYLSIPQPTFQSLILQHSCFVSIRQRTVLLGAARLSGL